MSDRGKGRPEDEQKARRDPNPMKPVSLNPVQLRNDPARQVPSQKIQARETPLITYGDHASPAKPIAEHRYDFSRVQELKPALRQEKSLNFALRPISVTRIQMQELRERRAAARDLGWTVPGHTIRIGE